MHLSPEHPATTDAFLGFIASTVAGRTGRFFILGDLFEYWAGDDDLDDPLAQRVVGVLRSLADDGVDVGFMAGNRDFLIGDAFVAAAGLRLLPDPFELRSGAATLLLSHGDALCIDDIDYQRFRAMVRQPAWQADFLSKPIAVRRAMVAGVRQQSEAAKREKAMAIMDVNAGAVGTLLAAHPGTILIHGHTHRPGRHLPHVGDAMRERRVLPDWDAEAVPRRGGGLGLVDGELVELPIR